MSVSTYEKKAEELLASAGIAVNGGNPWDVQVKDERVYKRVFSGGTTALGESYMDGWWDAEDLSSFFCRVLTSRIDRSIRSVSTLPHVFRASMFNLQSRHRAFEVGKRHYDIGNDLYEKMLDKRMTYTCAYWRDAKTLDEAQEAKLDLVCRKIGLKKGDRVLDIGGGWGSFAGFAAERYEASVVAITVSKKQQELGAEKTRGLPVEIRLQDYRDVSDGPYDYIVSLGMFEHVGQKNYRVYMEKVRSLLKSDGLFLLHTIGSSGPRGGVDPWFDRYVFPNGTLPSVAEIGKAIGGLFVLEDWHSFGAHYDTTLMEWFKNVDRSWPELKGKNSIYTDRFYRMWKYYLLSMAGSFRARRNQLWQLVLSPHGVSGGYRSIR